MVDLRITQSLSEFIDTGKDSKLDSSFLRNLTKCEDYMLSLCESLGLLAVYLQLTHSLVSLRYEFRGLGTARV